jgi:hypothetical protein
MSEDELYDHIHNNEFWKKLQYLKIDEELHSRLCAGLRHLAHLWANRTLIDKEMSAELYWITRTANYAACKTRDDACAVRAQDVALELDALIAACLGAAKLPTDSHRSYAARTCPRVGRLDGQARNDERVQAACRAAVGGR